MKVGRRGFRLDSQVARQAGGVSPFSPYLRDLKENPGTTIGAIPFSVL